MMTTQPPKLPCHNIVYVAPFGLRKKTTVWARTLPLARELVAAGHQATILIPPWDSPADAGNVSAQDGVRLEHVSLQGGLPAVVWRLLRRVDALAPSIVHIVKPRAHAGLVQWLLVRRHKPQPAVLLDIDDWEQAWNTVNRYPWPVARFLTWQEEWGIHHAQGITAASQWLMEQARLRNPQAPRLYLPNGVAALTDAAQPKAQSSTPRILFFSRFVETTPAWLAAFWQAVLATQPNAELWLAGEPIAPHLDAPFRSALDRLPGITWLGYIPGDRIPTLYAEVTCAIFPAEPVPLQLAKCSVRLATTLLHGVPVVASAVGEQAAYGAAGTATLVPPSATPAQFADALLTSLAQPPRDIAAMQTNMLSRYAWQDLARQLESFYRDFTGSPPPSRT